LYKDAARGVGIGKEMRGKKAERKKDINKERKEHSKGDDEGGGRLGRREPGKR